MWFPHFSEIEKPTLRAIPVARLHGRVTTISTPLGQWWTHDLHGSRHIRLLEKSLVESVLVGFHEHHFSHSCRSPRSNDPASTVASPTSCYHTLPTPPQPRPQTSDESSWDERSKKVLKWLERHFRAGLLRHSYLTDLWQIHGDAAERFNSMQWL